MRATFLQTSQCAAYPKLLFVPRSRCRSGRGAWPKAGAWPKVRPSYKACAFAKMPQLGREAIACAASRTMTICSIHAFSKVTSRLHCRDHPTWLQAWHSSASSGHLSCSPYTEPHHYVVVAMCKSIACAKAWLIDATRCHWHSLHHVVPSSYAEQC
jgi:hypothetical protein